MQLGWRYLSKPKDVCFCGFAFVVYSLLHHSKQTSKQNKTLQTFSTKMRVLFLTSCVFYPVKLAKANQLVQSYQLVLIEIWPQVSAGSAREHVTAAPPVAASLLGHSTQLCLCSQLLCSKVKNTLIYSSRMTETTNVGFTSHWGVHIAGHLLNSKLLSRSIQNVGLGCQADLKEAVSPRCSPDLAFLLPWHFTDCQELLQEGKLAEAIFFQLVSTGTS